MWRSLILLWEIVLGGDLHLGCLRESVHSYVATALMYAYLIISVVLLLNMLIAMMSESFSQIWSHRDVDYTFSTSRRTFSLIEQPPTPPPLCVISLPYAAVSLVLGVAERLREKMLDEDAKRERELRKMLGHPRVRPHSPPPSPPTSSASRTSSRSCSRA